jgi:SAM-dependent methyltransferase
MSLSDFAAKLSGLKLRWQLKRMQQDWDTRARENARYYIATGQTHWSDEAFYASGEKAVEEDILTDLTNIAENRDLKSLRMLEIGCGAGRMTRALAAVFGEIYAVDVSGEMVARAQAALSNADNVHVYQNSGCDLKVLPSLEFDFAYSNLVFQHIPSREVIESYVGEVQRVLRPGALFKFQVQGITGRARPYDTWRGVSFTQQEAVDLAERNNFEPRYSVGDNTQNFWLWYFKKT